MLKGLAICDLQPDGYRGVCRSNQLADYMTDAKIGGRVTHFLENFLYFVGSISKLGRVYNRETFLERKQVLEENINILNSQKEKILSNTPQLNSIDSPITILELYNRLENIKSKNQLLKNIFSKIYYSKIDNNIEITIYSKIPIK